MGLRTEDIASLGAEARGEQLAAAMDAGQGKDARIVDEAGQAGSVEEPTPSAAKSRPWTPHRPSGDGAAQSTAGPALRSSATSLAHDR